MGSINLQDLKQAVDTAKAELTETQKSIGVKGQELTKLQQRATNLEAFVSSANGLINAAPTGQDISAIGGVKIMV